MLETVLNRRTTLGDTETGTHGGGFTQGESMAAPPEVTTTKDASTDSKGDVDVKLEVKKEKEPKAPIIVQFEVTRTTAKQCVSSISLPLF